MSRGKPEVFHEFRVVSLKYRTVKAYLFELEGIPEAVWVPLSQADYDPDSRCVHISDWLVRQKPELLSRLESVSAKG
jgi:hypothetical protein